MEKENNLSPFVELNKASVKRNSKLLLDNISLTITQQENVVILGPNGASKSTFIKLLTGEYRPLYHERQPIKIFGQENWDLWELRSRIGLVSNELQFLYSREITGEEVILSGFFGSIGLFDHQKITKAQRLKALELSQFLEIESLNKQYISTMSSGEARRFLIGRALINDPQILILDEPTNSLDIRSRQKFLKVLRRVCLRGHSLVLVTQNVEDIIPEIERVIMLSRGKIMADGKINKLLQAKILSELYGISVKIKKSAGHYFLYPG
jgi:iron complex transport system ATP-binding protein